MDRDLFSPPRVIATHPPLQMSLPNTGWDQQLNVARHRPGPRRDLDMLIVRLVFDSMD
jgi:hypothetical protein